MRYLIVNGDDFGQTPGVTAGILEAHTDGILTSTSMLVDRPFSARAAELTGEFPELSVGLHLCLTDDREQLTMDPDDAQGCWSELCRQFDLFVELMGKLPTHLDSHHNVHRDTRLLPLFLELAHERCLPMREHSPVRYFSAFYGQWDGETHLEQISVEMLERMLRTEVGEGITELSCHPGQVDRELVSFYSSEREAELATLCEPSLRSLLAELKISLIGFRDIGNVSSEAASRGAQR